MSDSTTFSLRISRELKETLQRQAAAEGRSLNWYIARVLEAYARSGEVPPAPSYMEYAALCEMESEPISAEQDEPETREAQPELTREAEAPPRERRGQHVSYPKRADPFEVAPEELAALRAEVRELRQTQEEQRKMLERLLRECD